MPPQTPQTPGDDELETVEHPTLGTLKFPKNMPQEQRQQSIDFVIRQKYGLPEGTDLHAKDPETEAGKVDRNKYTNAYYEANTKLAAPQTSTRGYMANLLPNVIPKGSPFTWPVYGQAKAAYETGMGMARGLFGARARGEGLGRTAASTAAPLIGLNEQQVRHAADVGDIPGILGAITMPLGYAVAPLIGEAAGGGRAGRRGGTLPEVGGGGGGGGAGGPRGGEPPAAGGGGAEPLRPLPGPKEGPRAPTATEAVDAAVEMRFPGKKWDDLNPDQKMEVIRGGGIGGPPMAQDIVPRETPPTIPPAGGGAAAGKASPFTTKTDSMGITWAVTPGLPDISIPKRLQAHEIDPYVAEKQELQRQGISALPKGPGGLPTTEGIPAVPGAPAAAPRAPGEAPGTIPPAPAPTTLGGAREPAKLEELLPGWGGEREGTIPPSKPPEQPPPKKQ